MTISLNCWTPSSFKESATEGWMGGTESSEARRMAERTDGVGTIKFLESTSQMCDELKLTVVC